MLRENQYTRQLERLQEQLRTDLNEQKSKYEALIEGMRKKHVSLMTARDSEVSSTQERADGLQAHVDRLQRDILTLSNDKDKTESLMQEEQKRFSRRMDEYEKKFRDREEIRLTENRMLESSSQQYSVDRQE